MKYCTSCGSPLKEDEKFCSACGTKVVSQSQEESKSEPIASDTVQSTNKEKEGQYTKEGRKIIDAGPKPDQHQQYSPPPPTPKQTKKKKRGCLGCLGKSLLIIFVLIIVGVVIIWNLPDDETKTSSTTESTATEQTINTQTSKKIKAVNKKPVSDKTEIVTPENPTAVLGEVKLDFGAFNIDKQKKVTVKQFPENIIDNECKIVTYDISLKGTKQLNDYMTITLPYDKSFIKKGKVEDCIIAQYFNERTKEWEPVLFEIDTKEKVVHIETDHLSKYGVFTIKNDTKRRAYVSGFYIPERYFKADKDELHLEVIDKYYSEGRSLGEEALSQGLSFWGQFAGHSGAAINTLTLGGTYSTKFIDKLNDRFKNAGYVFSAVQLAYDLWRGDQKSAAINLTKNLMSQMVAEIGSTSLNLAFVGVYMIDYSLTTFGNAAMASRYEELFKVYNYYNKTQNSHRRTLKEWRAFFIEIEQENQNNPKEASDLIMEEIDAYSREFIQFVGLGTNSENTMEFNALAGEAGVKSVAWPNPDDVSRIQQEGKQQLIDKLYPVFASLNHYRINKMKEQLNKECAEIQKIMNTVVPITITEDLDKGEEPEYANHIVCIRPLDDDADKKQWTGKLDKKGYIKTSFTIIGYVLAGEPNRVEIYDPEDTPDDDDPIFEKEFVINTNGIVVHLNDNEPEVKIGAIIMRNEKRYDEPKISKDGINDPLQIISSIKDFDIKVKSDGSFNKTISGNVFENSYDNNSQFDINNGRQLKVGNIILKGKIDNMNAIFNDFEKNAYDDLMVGTMSYKSNASFSIKETYKGIGKGGRNIIETIYDYSYTVSGEYNLFISRDARKMDAPLVIEAVSTSGRLNCSGLPKEIANRKTFENSITFKLVIN